MAEISLKFCSLLTFLVSFQTLFLSFALYSTPSILTIVYLASVSGDALITTVAATQGYHVASPSKIEAPKSAPGKSPLSAA